MNAALRSAVLRRAILPGLALLAACGPPQRIGTNVHHACDAGTTDTAGWRRVPAPFPGYTVLAPPTLAGRRAEGSDVMWEDGRRSVRVFRRPWGRAQFHDRNANRANYSSCWTRVAGMRTYVVVRRVDNGYQVTGWYRRAASLPRSAGPLDGIVSGASAAAADQSVFLRMIRSLEPARR